VLIRYIYWCLNKKDINTHRETLQLPPLKRSILKNITEQKILNRHAIKLSLIARPKEWPAEIQITGFLTIPESKRKNNISHQLTVRLETWLKNRERPIYIGFGSIPIPDTELLSSILIELIATTNHCFIFCQMWSELPKLPRHENLFIIRNANHEWLFPQCKTAIIHGGIGTIAAALKAGIPPIIISIFADQPLWGKLIANKNLGIHIAFKNLSLKQILNEIEKTQTFEVKQSQSY